MSCSDLPRRSFLAVAAGATLAAAGPARAQSLDEARLSGYLGERPDGYLAQRDPAAPGWALDLMAGVNARRRAKYEELADKNGTSLRAVEVVAGEKIIQSLPAGGYYMDANGDWVRK